MSFHVCPEALTVLFCTIRLLPACARILQAGDARPHRIRQ
jgi:hypothetical protein